MAEKNQLRSEFEGLNNSNKIRKTQDNLINWSAIRIIINAA
jgi:hypothetical protein